MSEIMRVFSVFDFDDPDHLFSFLYEQQKAGKAVYFENEDMTLHPKQSIEDHVKLSCYMAIKGCPDIVRHYINWLVIKNCEAHSHED